MMPKKSGIDVIRALRAEKRIVPILCLTAKSEIDAKVAGFAGICPSRDPIDSGLGELDTIAVHPSRWRSGAGRALMAVAIEHLIIDGYQEAILWTLAGYQHGLTFYAATGWHRDGGTRDHERQVRLRQLLHIN